MKKIANSAAYLFIILVVVLTFISILGVWDFFKTDVIWKSFESMGLLALVAVIVLVADHFSSAKAIAAPSPVQNGMVPGVPVAPMPQEDRGVFSGIRMATLTLLIICAALLALLGIMAIWDVLAGDILHKSLASIAILGFSSLVIVITCLEREDNPLLKNRSVSGGSAVLVIIFLWLMASFFFR